MPASIGRLIGFIKGRHTLHISYILELSGIIFTTWCCSQIGLAPPLQRAWICNLHSFLTKYLWGPRPYTRQLLEATAIQSLLFPSSFLLESNIMSWSAVIWIFYCSPRLRQASGAKTQIIHQLMFQLGFIGIFGLVYGLWNFHSLWSSLFFTPIVAMMYVSALTISMTSYLHIPLVEPMSQILEAGIATIEYSHSLCSQAPSLIFRINGYNPLRLCALLIFLIIMLNPQIVLTKNKTKWRRFSHE